MSDEFTPIPPMREDRFWGLVEMSGGDADKMTSMLMWFPKEDIIAFDLRMGDALDQLDREGIYAMTGGSADGFLDIRCWIVSRGREYYEAVLADPAKAPEDEEDTDNESFGYAACEAYEALFGEEAFWDAKDKHWRTSREIGSNRAGWPIRPRDQWDE